MKCKTASLVVILLMILSTHIFSEQSIFRISGGALSYKYKVEGQPLYSNLLPTAGIGLEYEHGNAQIRMVIDAFASHHNQMFRINNKNHYYNILRIDTDVLLKFRFQKKTITSPYITFGGFGAIIIASETDSEGTKKDSEAAITVLPDYGPVVGAGLEFFLTKFALILEGRYRFGLAKSELAEVKFKNEAIFVMVAIKFY